jgi:hypothetical protein
VLNIEQAASRRSVIFVPTFTAPLRGDTGFQDGTSNMLILLIILVLLFGGGGGYYGHSRWGPGGGAGVGLGTILLIVLIVYLLGGLR